MPDAVKISDLPSLSTVTKNDIVPIVDSALTQTSKCTVAQIAAIGGGPPGDGLVTTASLASGAVTAAKTSFSATDRLLGRSTTGPGTGEEIPCTSYARGLLNVANAASARSYLDALQGTNSPTFTGTVQVNGDLNVTGLVNDAAFLSLGADNVERMRLFANGNIGTPIPSSAVVANDFPSSPVNLYPAFHCRAWVNFNGNGSVTINGSGNVSSVSRQSLGIYHVNFTKPMPDAGYVVHHSGAPTVVLNNGFLIHCVTGIGFPDTTYTSAKFSVCCFGPFDSTDRVDSGRVLVSVFR